MNILAKIVAALVMLASVSGTNAQVTDIFGDRSVRAFGCTPFRSDSRTGPPFPLPFTGFVSLSCDESGGSAQADQFSTLTTSRFVCSQRAIASGDADSTNRFVILFTVTQPINFSVNGMTNSESTSVRLTGPGDEGPDVFPPISNTTRTETGTLTPGRYTLWSIITGDSQAPEARASFQADFSIPPPPPPPFTIDWSTIDGGGAMNLTGGPFTVSGTIGQCDSTARATLTGGPFSITGGFWAVVLPRCDADINNDGFVNSQDFFDFLTAFFALNPLADFNRNGSVNSQDFFDFLSAFFNGCP